MAIKLTTNHHIYRRKSYRNIKARLSKLDQRYMRLQTTNGKIRTDVRGTGVR